MIFDAHGDILTDLYQQVQKGNKQSFRTRHLDDYKNAGITHSIFVNWANPADENPHLMQDIFVDAFEELAQMRDIFHIITSYKDMDISIQENKIGVILGIEGLSHLKDVSELRDYYQKGVRHATLTWNEVNHFAGGLSSETYGLTLLGEEILTEMERLGMIIDLAHSNPISFQDILDHTTGPVIISHGNVKALCPHIRNYTDDQLLAIKARGGVVGICAIAPFLATDESERTVTTMAKHVDYAVQLLGIDHVGVGFDVCYYLSEHVTSNHVEGFQSIADAGNLFVELKRMGYSESDIQKIKYDNFARIVQQVLR